MKIVAVVVLYHPDLKILYENLMAFTYQVNATLIWDNSPTEAFVKNEDFLRNRFPHLIIQGDGTNHGISYGLNKAWDFARQNHYDALLTMDQDSTFSDFEFSETEWKINGKRKDCVFVDQLLTSRNQTTFQWNSVKIVILLPLECLFRYHY